MDIKDLIFIQSADNYIDVYYKRGDYITRRLIRSSLTAVEKELEHPDLVRCHRSYIINLRHAKQKKRSKHEMKIESGGKIYNIPVSRTYKEQVKNAMDSLN